MATTADYLTQLQADKQVLVDNLVAKGVSATNDETFTSLVPKVAEISGGSAITKGVIVETVDDNGFASEIKIVGLTEVPNGYCSGNTGGANIGFLEKLTKVILDENITKIGEYAFNYQKKLTHINLHNSITEIGKYAFTQNNALTINSLPENLQKIGEWCFSYILDTEITFPIGVTELPDSVMRNCSKLEKIVCNGDITSIGALSFFYDRVLKTFVLPNITTVPTLSSSNAFDTTSISSGTGYIYVPDFLVEDFKVATNWSTYADQIKGISEL